MNFKILTETELHKYDNEILNMLIGGDDEFVPPLSTRTSTTQSDLTGSCDGNNGVHIYFEQLKKQRILVSLDGDKLIGFVSFIENFVSDKIGDEYLPNIYISTLLVSPDARGKGLTGKMYGFLFEQYKTANAFTRTWSTNEAHIRILSKFGFETMHVLKNDRGTGVDTVYFKKIVTEI